MAVRTRDLFGATPTGDPAVPGSYGEPPAGGRLPDHLRLGAVRLRVSDLARSVAFYEQVLGLRVRARDATGARLSAAGDDAVLVELRERGGVTPYHAARLGLYHFAIRLPDRASLGRLVRHLGAIGMRAGAADHLVSEALYLHDPDGLGVEVYADRPREAWRRVGRELMMASDPLDVAGLEALAGDAPWDGMPAGTVMGHVHLHVGDLTRASTFYADALGFDRVVWHYPGALFLSAGGYHHHLGTNTWAGPGAAPAAEDEPQLLDWSIVLPNVADVDAVAGRLEAAGTPVTREADGVLARDPWGTVVRIRGGDW